MILAALDRYYHRLASQAGKVPPYGFSDEKISFAIVLSEQGRVLAVEDLRQQQAKKKVPVMLDVPRPEKRTVGISANFLWDKTSYALGIAAEPTERTVKEHQAFAERHIHAISSSQDRGARALLSFLASWSVDQFISELFPEEIKDTNIVFRLDGDREFIHERAPLRAIWLTLCGSEGAEKSQCMVSGQLAPATRLHPSIKNVDGAQSSGAALVSFNLDAFNSYGKEQGANAAVSESVAFTYGAALNYLLRRDPANQQRLKLGDTTAVFWAEADNDQSTDSAESFFAAALSPSDSSETQALIPTMQQIAAGRPLRELRPDLDENTRFYILGLSPNAARISVRFWQADSLGNLARNLAWHYQDIAIQPEPWKTPPAVWKLLYETAAFGKAENIAPQLAGELTRAILTGGLYPQTLLSAVIIRMRADKDLRHDQLGLRAAICKACINRKIRKTQSQDKEIPMSLDLAETNTAYRLGRLFAVLEEIQRAALGGQVNATIRDRYYGAASATPASVFPLLLKNTMNHLAKVRKDKPGWAVNLEKSLGEIMDGMGTNFPRNLRLEEQGRFVIGYYHQHQQRFAGKPDATEAVPTNSEEN